MSLLRICTNKEMRSLDQIAEIEMGIGPVILMENAGRAATEIILREYPKAGLNQEILVFAGKGNNAGDAFVVARQLLCLGRKVRVFHLIKGVEYKGATAGFGSILRPVTRTIPRHRWNYRHRIKGKS
jgi:NAD(P)H-hydrate repair Nnr-like enzyme with NAD(P)H-hydrate epimerase domain